MFHGQGRHGDGADSFAFAASFFWYPREQGVEHISNLHPVILIAVGLGVLFASHSIRRAAKRIADLEDQIASLQKTSG
jgi:hypothetical protein